MTQGTCSACGDEGRIIRGWCSAHYQRWLKHGDPLPLIPKRIFGNDRARFESYVDRSGGPDTCHPWTGGLDDNGYGHIGVNGKSQYAHKFGWELDNEPVPPDEELDHECHNQAVRDGTCRPGVCPHRRCCNNRHIVPRIREDHAKLTAWGDSRLGSRNGRSKLDETTVRGIKASLAAGDMLQQEIATQYGVAETTINAISTGQNWSHIT